MSQEKMPEKKAEFVHKLFAGGMLFVFLTFSLIPLEVNGEEVPDEVGASEETVEEESVPEEENIEEEDSLPEESVEIVNESEEINEVVEESQSEEISEEPEEETQEVTLPEETALPVPEETASLLPEDETTEDETTEGEVAGESVLNEPSQASEENNDQTTLLPEEVQETLADPITEESVVETGDAVAVASVLNVVNTNIFNSDGLFLFLNNLLSGIGTIDIRLFDIFKAPTTEVVSESLGGDMNTCEECGGNYTSISTTNTAHLDNVVVVRSETGGNTIEGYGSITSGNAYAAADIINIANTTIADSNYLMMVVDNIGDWENDLVFPSAYIFNKLFSSIGSSGGHSADISNSGTVENEINVQASTGGNEVSGTGSIATGDATATANVINQVNQNFIDSDSFVILFRIHGNWTGKVFGAPEGLMWSESDDGITLMLSPGSSGGSGGGSMLGVTNDASIKNNVEIYALTGENKVEGDGSITSGNAHAAANIINVANTNVVGRNWMLAIVNIFGDWTGNLSFGRPDLWVGISAEAPEEILEPGDKVKFTYTISNNGDADAHNIFIENDFDNHFLSFDDSLIETLEKLAPGQTREITRHARVVEDLPYGEMYVTNKVKVSADEPDANTQDNEDVVSFGLKNPQPIPQTTKSSAPEFRAFIAPKLKVRKEASAYGVTKSGVPIEYVVHIHNDSRGPAFNAVLVDQLLDPKGDVLQEQGWELGRILPNEKISIRYTVTFNDQALPGKYTNTAVLKARGVSNRDGLGIDKEYKSNAVTVTYSSTSQEENIEGEVLGDAICSAYITSYIRPGFNDNNRSEVERLQTFLNTFYGAELEVTGDYDLYTELALKEFQAVHAAEILEPWGIPEPTGYVYYTTQKKINEIYCGDAIAFPLTSSQEEEIAAFRNNRFAGSEPSEPRKLLETARMNLSIVRDEEGVAGAVLLEKSPKATPTKTFFSRIKERITGFFSQIFASVPEKVSFEE